MRHGSFTLERDAVFSDLMFVHLCASLMWSREQAEKN